MKKSILIISLISATSSLSFAVDNTKCSVLETRGHATEEYKITLAPDELGGSTFQPSFKLFKDVYAEVDRVDGKKWDGGKNDEYDIILQSKSIPGAETNGEALLGEASGLIQVKLESKIGLKKDESIKIECPSRE